MKNQINVDVEEKRLSKDTSQKPESHILSQRSQQKCLSHSEQQNQQYNEDSEKELNLQQGSKQRCKQIRLTQFMNSTKLQLVCMIMVPELFFIIISIMLVQMNLQYTSDSVSKFSQNLFEQSVDFVKKQASAVQMSLELQLQNEAIMLNAMHSLQFQAIRGELLFQSGFKKPVLNVDRTYLNQGDPYLLQQFKNNFTLFISSWHQKNAIEENQLDSFSSSQLDITPRINFLLRSALYANQADPSIKNKLLIQQYTFPFGSDGMLIFTKGANYSYASFVDQPPCTAGAYKLDTRCRPYFYTTKNKDIVTAFPPTVLQSGATSSSYHVSSGFCKRQPLPLSLLDKFQVNSLNNGIYSLICNSIQLEQIQFLFERFSSDSRVLIMLLDPVSMKLVYNSDTQAKLITFDAAYLKNLDSQSNRDYFLLQVQQYAAQKMKTICYDQRQDYHQNAEDYSFNFTQEGKETIVFINHISSFDLSQTHTDDVYGENSPITLDSGLQDYQPNQKRKMCVSSFWIFLIVIPKDQLMQQAYTLEQQMDTINIIFQVMIYIGLGISALLFFIYLKQISYTMDAPIQRLTSILKEMNVCEATVAYNHLSEKESEDLFFSSDARVLFESFRKLFVTLVFATQSMLGDKQCQTLLNLNKQILHFKQLQNYRAVGICSNNIGNIHHNNSRYIEALENYQMAILYAQYELQLYKEQTTHKEVRYPSLSHTYHKVSSFFKKLTPFQDLSEQKLSSNILKEPQKHPDFQQNENTQEIYWVLYNRKFNFLKSLIGLMGSQESSFTDWPTAKILADDLQTISDTNLLPNEKRKIILNHVELYIHCHTGDLDTYMRLLNENKTILISPGFNKPVKIHQSKIRKDNFRKSNVSSHAGTPNDKGSQSVFLKKEKSIHLNKSDISDSSIDASYNYEREEQQGDISSINQHNYMPYEDDQIQIDKNNQISEEEIKDRKQSYHCLELQNRFDWKQPTEDDTLKEKGVYQKHVTLEDNLQISRSQLNSSNFTPYSEINNQTIEKFHESGQNLIELSSSKQLKLEENKSLLLLRRNPQKTHILKHFAATKESNHQLKKNPSYDSFNHRNDRIESNQHRHSMQIRSFNKNNNSFESQAEYFQGKDKKAIRKISKSMKQSDISQGYLKPKVNSKWFINSQVDISRSIAFGGKIKSKQVNEINDYPCSSAPNNTTHRTTLTTTTKQEINQLSQSKVRLVNYDNNPYMQENALFSGIVSWEEATLLLLKRQLFESASEFTLFFEDTYNALPIMQYQAFDMLAFILSSARLRDSTLEQMASIYEFDTSFRIQILVFESFGINVRNYEKIMDLMGKNGENQNQEQQEHEQEQFSRQTLIRARNFEDPKDELQYFPQKQTQQLADAAERICLDIIQKVMRKPDDMIGIAVASSPWQIESKMEMVSFKLLNLNTELFGLIAHNLVVMKNQHQPIDKEKISIDEHIVRLNSSGTIHNSIQLNSLLLTSSVPENKQELFQQTLTTSHTPEEGQDRFRILERQIEQQRNENKTKKDILDVSPLLLQITGQQVQLEQLQQHHPLHPRLQQGHQNSTIDRIKMQEKGITELDGLKSIEQLSHQLPNKAEPIICNSKLMIEKPQNEVKQIECHEAMIINPDPFYLATEGDEEKNEMVNKQFEYLHKQYANSSGNNRIERQKHKENTTQNILSSEGIPIQGKKSTIKIQGDFQGKIVSLGNYSKHEQNEVQQILNFQQKTEECTNSPLQNIKNDLGYSKQSISKKTAELRVLFIMAARKSLQSVLLHEGGQPNQIYFQVKLAETRATFIDELDLLQEKRPLNYFELHKKQDRQISKKFSIIITNQLYFISPTDQALVTLYKQSMRFSVPLFILCLNEEEAIQFQKGIPTEYSEIVLVFTSEKILIDHLFSERAPLNFNFFPLSVEHF